MSKSMKRMKRIPGEHILNYELEDDYLDDCCSPVKTTLNPITFNHFHLISLYFHLPFSGITQPLSLSLSLSWLESMADQVCLTSLLSFETVTTSLGVKNETRTTTHSQTHLFLSDDPEILSWQQRCSFSHKKKLKFHWLDLILSSTGRIGII